MNTKRHWPAILPQPDRAGLRCPSKPHRIEARLGVVFLVTLALAVAPGPLRAQESVPTPATTADATGPSLEGLQARIKQIEERTDLDSTIKTTLLEVYRQAVDAARAGAAWSARAAALVQAQQDAPQRLDEIKAELARRVTEVNPAMPPDASLSHLEQLLTQHEAELKTFRADAASLAKEHERRTDRRAEIPRDVAAAKEKLEALAKQQANIPPADKSPELLQAREALRAARKRAIGQELATYDSELQSYDARTELLTARRDLASRRIAAQEALVRVWRDEVSRRRRVEADRAAREAQRTARRQATAEHAVVKHLADANAVLAKRRADSRIADKIERANKDLDSAESLRARIADDQRRIRDRIDKAGLTKAMGLLLRNRLETLPDPPRYARKAQQRSIELAHVQIEIIELEEQRGDLGDIDLNVAAAAADLDPTVSENERRELVGTVRDLYETRRTLLDSLINDFAAYRDALFQLDAKEAELVRQIETTRDYVLEHIFWVPSTSPPTARDAGRLLRAFGWFVDPAHWRSVGATVYAGIRAHWVYVVVAIPFLVVMLVLPFRLRPYLRAQGIVASRSTTATIAPTVKALIATVAISLRWPLVLLFLAWLLRGVRDAPPFAATVASGLGVTVPFLTVAALFRAVCRLGGLADVHFELPGIALRTMRRYMLGLMGITVPLVFVVGMVEHQDDAEFWSTLGRLAFVLIHLALAVFAVRTRSAAGAIIRESTHAHHGGWIDRLRYVWAPLAVGVPIGLVILSLAGYYYTALKLAILFQETLWMVVGLILLNALLLRWLLVARRKLAIEQYRKRRAAAVATAESAASTPREVGAEPEAELDLSAISLQTRALVRSLVGFALIAGLWFVWVDVLPALNVLDRVVLWTSTQQVTETVASPGADGVATTSTVARVVPVTLAHVGLAALILVMSFIALRNLPGLLEIAILQRLPLQQSSRYAVTTLSRYAITIVGLVFALGAVGINWSNVQWLAAAVTVGLGFGLQEIFANFVSGLIILFERPIRVGDIVTVGDTTGSVARIQMRATTILDWNRLELIVPNKDFITGRVVNWTLSTTVTRVVIPVGIAYGSDTETARDLLVDIAKRNPQIMDDPAPWAIFNGFGDSTLNLTLYMYIATRDVWATVMHSMHTNIDQAFREAGIEIAFPQQDVHIRTINGPFQVTKTDAPGTLEPTVQRREH